MRLEQFGWSDFLRSSARWGVPARVAAASHEQMVVWTEGGGGACEAEWSVAIWVATAARGGRLGHAA